MTEKKTRGIKFPISIEAGDRQFTIMSADTTELWYLYGRYEALMASLASGNPDAPISFDGAKSRDMIGLMIELCELCHENGQNVIFKHAFGPGEQTPRVLAGKVIEALFSGFLTVNGQPDFQPLAMEMARPLMRSTVSE